jgi:hypothetical protein
MNPEAGERRRGRVGRKNLAHDRGSGGNMKRFNDGIVSLVFFSPGHCARTWKSGRGQQKQKIRNPKAATVINC